MISICQNPVNHLNACLIAEIVFFVAQGVLNREQASIDEGDLEDFYNRIADFRICQSILNNGTEKSLYREIHGRSLSVFSFDQNVENI